MKSLSFTGLNTLKEEILKNGKAELKQYRQLSLKLMEKISKLRVKCLSL